MINFDHIFSKDLYSQKKDIKKPFFLKNFKKINQHHYNNCRDYKKFFNSLISLKNLKNIRLEDFPMLPVNIFKYHQLMSVPKSSIVKKMTSSGTSSKNLSNIFLDKENSINQKKTLSKIVENFLGKERLPMLIIDKKSSIYNKEEFNAKTAAVMGFSLFGKDYTFLINENDQIEYDSLNNFLKKNGQKKFLVFGFTSYIYQHLIKDLSLQNLNFDFKNSYLIHGGGWKKLEDKKINNLLFKQKLKNKLNISNIFNYYGMIEQTGSIFIECKAGFFHTTIFSDIFVRDLNLDILDFNKKGIIQLISLLPTSYPGHNILTEDIGIVHGEDNCSCGLKGKYFSVIGRVKKTELRGCSDVR